MVGEAERHVAAGAGEHIEEKTNPSGTAGNVVEHDARAVVRAQHDLRSEPDILLPARSMHGANFAETLGEGQPLSQVVERDLALDVARAAHDVRFLSPFRASEAMIIAPSTPFGQC